MATQPVPWPYQAPPPHNPNGGKVPGPIIPANDNPPPGPPEGPQYGKAAKAIARGLFRFSPIGRGLRVGVEIYEALSDLVIPKLSGPTLMLPGWSSSCSVSPCMSIPNGGLVSYNTNPGLFPDACSSSCMARALNSYGPVGSVYPGNVPSNAYNVFFWRYYNPFPSAGGRVYSQYYRGAAGPAWVRQPRAALVPVSPPSIVPNINPNVQLPGEPLLNPAPLPYKLRPQLPNENPLLDPASSPAVRPRPYSPNPGVEVWPSPVPGEKPNIVVSPVPGPVTRPLPGPAPFSPPVAGPRPRPGQAPKWSYARGTKSASSPGARSHGRKPPRGKFKDNKPGKGPVGKALSKAASKLANGVTESADFAEALWDAMPPWNKTLVKGQKTTPLQMAVDLAGGFDSIDWAKAAKNLAVNEAVDQGVGRTVGKGTKMANKKKPLGLGGVALGPAL